MEGNLAVLIVSHLHVAEQLEKQQLSRNTRANLKDKLDKTRRY